MGEHIHHYTTLTGPWLPSFLRALVMILYHHDGLLLDRPRFRDLADESKKILSIEGGKRASFPV